MIKPLVFLVFFTSSFTFAQSEHRGQALKVNSKDEFTYKTPNHDHSSYRNDEVEQRCKSVLSSASELSLDRSGFYSNIKQQLSFENGDWRQEHGKNHPIMPFYDINHVADDSTYVHETPLNLVSFRVVDTAHQSRKSVSVSGFLLIGITLDGFLKDRAYGDPWFRLRPGHSVLLLAFHGVYTESQKNGGERVLCLLGNGLLPSRDRSTHGPWPSVPLLPDDQILLVLHYPMEFTLTKREIHGVMRSLNLESDLKYFDEVHITSQLGESASYQFKAEKLISKACDSYPYDDGLTREHISTYRGSSFCKILEEVTKEQAFTILPNLRKQGPFHSDGGFQAAKLHMQNVKCEQKMSNKNDISAKVSAVFRAVSPSENLQIAYVRSGLSNMTMVSEGIWKSSSGKLCMVGCLGTVDFEKNLCVSRISLYIPISFTIKQRRVIVGSISGITRNRSYIPLSFEMPMQHMENWHYFDDSRPFYTYTEIVSAGAVLEKTDPFGFQAAIKRLFLHYPKLEEAAESCECRMCFLPEDLTFHAPAFSNPVNGFETSRTYVTIEILSIGPFFRQYWANASMLDVERAGNRLLLNVSSQLSLTGNSLNNVSVLFLEGIYDQNVGKMYLVGCRDLTASWEVFYELEDGLDCQVEVVVSYPPTMLAQWFIDPTAKISISSRRQEDDPLYFSSMKLETLPIAYTRKPYDILARKSVYGVLEISTLSLAIACICSQISYSNQNVEFVPYISLTMLGIQSLGYALPLITGAEALFKQRANLGGSYALDDSRLFLVTVLECTAKLLVIVSLVLTLRLLQKVRKYHVMLFQQELQRAPSDKLVLIATLFIHLVSYVIVLSIHTSKMSTRIQVESSMIPSSAPPLIGRLQGWGVSDYIGLVQDFFLLPQLIGNSVWQIDCRPLRKLYFIGTTVVRLVPHIHEYLRAPYMINPYFSHEPGFENSGSMDMIYSKLGHISVTSTALILVVVVYIQQQWNYEKLSQALIIGRIRLLPRASRKYKTRNFEQPVSAAHGNCHDETNPRGAKVGYKLQLNQRSNKQKKEEKLSTMF